MLAVDAGVGLGVKDIWLKACTADEIIITVSDSELIIFGIV